MAHKDNVIPMKLDSQFYKKLGDQKFHQQEYKKAASYFAKVLEMSPQDFETKVKYSECLVSLGIGSKAEHLFMKVLHKVKKLKKVIFN